MYYKKSGFPLIMKQTGWKNEPFFEPMNILAFFEPMNILVTFVNRWGSNSNWNKVKI